jgi:hypothetical protein
LTTSPTPPTPRLYNGRQCIDICMFTLALGREAGNQKDDAIMCVACSIRNRVLRPNFWNWGSDYESVLEKKWAYSSIEGPANDPNLLKYPNLNAEPWERCLAIAELVYAGGVNDPTDGATHYFDISLDPEQPGGLSLGKPDRRPSWGTNGSMVHTYDCGSFHFFRPAVINLNAPRTA